MKTDLFNEKDLVMTPEWVTKFIIEQLSPSGSILDPCRGEGAFFKNLPGEPDYCEIREGIDFFEYSKKVNWIISNPPYSILLKFLEKSFEVSENVSFLLPINKVFQSQKVMRLINQYGGIKSIFVFGDGRQYMGFPFGYSVANFHFKKYYKGQTEIVFGIDEIKKLSSLTPPPTDK